MDWKWGPATEPQGRGPRPQRRLHFLKVFQSFLTVLPVRDHMCKLGEHVTVKSCQSFTTSFPDVSSRLLALHSLKYKLWFCHFLLLLNFWGGIPICGWFPLYQTKMFKIQTPSCPLCGPLRHVSESTWTGWEWFLPHPHYLHNICLMDQLQRDNSAKNLIFKEVVGIATQSMGNLLLFLHTA